MIKFKFAAGVVIIFFIFGGIASAQGETCCAADAPKSVKQDGKPQDDPWVGEFRVYEGRHGEKGEFLATPSQQYGGKVTIAAKGDSYVFEGRDKIELVKDGNRLVPSSKASFILIEQGATDAKGSSTLQVVASFRVFYLVRDIPPATWIILPGDGQPKRSPSPHPAVLSDWRSGVEYRLNGLNHVKVDDHNELHLQALTLSAWVNTEEINAVQPIMAKALSKGNWNSYLLRVQDGGRVSLVIGNVKENREAHWISKAALSAKKWHHVAVTWACTKGDASDAKIYLDGVEQEVEMNRSVNYGLGFKIGYSAEPLYIGRDEMPSGHLLGSLRNVDITDRVLIAQEMQATAQQHSK
jgi:hypothetical protein